MGGVVDWAIDLNGFGADTITAGPGANIVYPPPSIWDSIDDRWTGCTPPCIIILPPYPLSEPHIVTSWPSLTTTLLSSDVAGGGVYVKTTTIPVPTFTIEDVSLHPVTLQSTDTAEYKINPVQSITAASFLWTLPPYHATFPVTTPIPMTPTDTEIPIPTIPPSVTFHTTPIPVTIQPQPTYSIDYPDPLIDPAPVTIKADPTPTPSGCTGDKCGKRNCLLFGCDGGCSVTGCIANCPLESCAGLGCLVPGGCGNTQGSDGGDSSDECESPATASACTYLVTSYSAWYLASSSTITYVSGPRPRVKRETKGLTRDRLIV